MRESIFATIPSLDPSAKTVDEILDATDLNWQPELRQATVECDGEEHEAPMKGVFRLREGRPAQRLAFVGTRWQMIDHRRLVELMVELSRASGLKIVRAGMLSNNAAVGFYLPWEDGIDISERKKGDIVNFGLLGLFPYGGNRAHQIALMAERLICLNGMTVPVERSALRVPHHSRSLEQLQYGFQEFLESRDFFVARSLELRERKLEIRDALAYLTEVAGDPELPLPEQPKRVREAFDLFANGTATGFDLGGGYNAWNLFNAFVEAFQDVGARSKKTSLERATDDNARLVADLNKLLDKSPTELMRSANI